MTYRHSILRRRRVAKRTSGLARDPYCRTLVTSITNSVNGAAVETFAYAYDALSRPVTRNADSFGYNVRGEVVSATIGGNYETHEYDSIGNSIITSFNGTTNAYSANSLNQYTTVGRVVPNAPPGGADHRAARESVTKERLTDLSNELRSETFAYQNGALALHAYSSFDPTNAILTEVSESATEGTTVTRSKYGIVFETTAPSGTTSSFFDPYGRVFYTEKDGRSVDWIGRNDFGDVEEYDIFHAPGDNVYAEFYGYDNFGNRTSATNALGAVTVSAYDAANRLSQTGGAVYPVRNGYDTEGRRTSLTTFRTTAGRDVPIAPQGDTTSWTFDPATGFCTLKTYADGSTVAYTYTPDGKPLRTTYASGRWCENAYNAKRELVSTEYSDGETCSFAYDEFSHEIAASNNIATVVQLRSDYGQSTNETIVVGNETYALDRSFDPYGRMIRNDGSDYTFAADGQLATMSNAIVSVEYHYTPDRLDAGYTLTLINGVSVTHSLMRDTYRRSLVTRIESSVGGNVIEGLVYSYDALNRPVSRNADSFGYNARSEVTYATIGGIANSYGYDDIGNNTDWMPNNLNQYSEFTYDLDGNLLSDGVRTFTYDAANRLKTVSTNGVLALTNFYDAKSRRVRKVTAAAMTIFFYDDWNLIEERVAYTNGTTSTIHYYWGKDLSGTLQGAGGVGGLLYLTVNGTVYIPTYDNNGNITRYLDANGNTVAQYTYDAFGNIISKSGPLADFFHHRFSTKYYDAETGLYYYGYRFYHPILMRWLNRDPIEEEGGLNLYVFCENFSISIVDFLGKVPMGSTFLNAYTPYNYSHGADEIWRAVGGTLKAFYWNDETKRPPNTCATRISIALIKSNEPVSKAGKQFVNTVKKGEKGIAGNYIVNAAKMQDYLTSAWGTASVLSPTQAYYFKSKVKSFDIAGLRKEIEEKLKCSNVPKDKYVCVVSAKVTDEPGISGHIGVVTKTYDDGESPYKDHPVVWILPPTKKVATQKK